MRYKSNLKLDEMVQNLSNQSLMQLAQATKETWASSAKKALNTTAQDYINAIQMNVKLGSSPSVELYLKGTWANKLEHGFPSYDMKPYYASGSKTKISEEDGAWYAHIPFEHRTTSATGRTGKVMPSSVYNSARKLPSWGKLSSKGTAKSWGVHEGMQKVPTNETKTRHKYMTVRTVSENSPPEAFIHPGFEGVHLQEQISEQIPDTFAKLFSDNSKYFK